MTTTATDHLTFVGIDPSLTGTGICILDGPENTKLTISTTSKSHRTRYERLDFIVQEILGRISGITSPSVCIERPFVNPKNMNSQQDIIALGYLIRRELYYHHIPHRDISPMALKKFVCGTGKAEKSMMLMRVFQNWNISADDDNQADAVGLAFVAKALHDVTGRRDRTEWYQYQIDVALKILEGKQ